MGERSRGLSKQKDGIACLSSELLFLFPFCDVEVLSPEGDLREAAVNLFAAIRRLDALNLDVILAESVPEVGLGRAIMDRLRRASRRENIH